MVIFIAGSTHTGKTLLAQKLLEKYGYPYLSIDHIKMGLIRSGCTSLTPEDDDKLTDYLWPIIRETAKTAVENNQNLIIEGCYIPFDYAKDFTPEYLKSIRYICLIFSEKYIRNHFEDIVAYENVIESRLTDDCTVEVLLRDNKFTLEQCTEQGGKYILIDEEYNVDFEL